MKITEVELYRVNSGNRGEKGAEFGESQYWGGGWQTHSLIANPMSGYSKYSGIRSSWMGPGQDPSVIPSPLVASQISTASPASMPYTQPSAANLLQRGKGGRPVRHCFECTRLYRDAALMAAAAFGGDWQ